MWTDHQTRLITSLRAEDRDVVLGGGLGACGLIIRRGSSHPFELRTETSSWVEMVTATPWYSKPDLERTPSLSWQPMSSSICRLFRFTILITRELLNIREGGTAKYFVPR